MVMMRRLAAILLMCLLAVGLAHAQSIVSDVQTTVDFELLSRLNPDCVGWLYQMESGLNRPVMQHENNEWYHERVFDQTKVYQVGSAYILSEASLNDDVVVVFGQAREEGCFSMIPDWREQETVRQRSPFRLLTPQGDHQAQVFACLVIEAEELDSWYPAQNFDQWLAQVQSASLIQTDAALLPKRGDRLMFIAGLHPNGKCTLLMTALAPIVYTAETQQNLIKLELDSAETLNGLVDAGPAGELLFYAQNDPLYASMRYESAIRHDVRRDFGGGGCGPTAMAIIAANLVDREDLPLIGRYAKSELGNLFCPCSVNRVYCDHTHVPYQLQTPEEYLRYLPVAMADFAAGNNAWDFLARRVDSSGTNIRFADYVCELYGLSVTPISGLDAALELMKEKTGEGLILCCALRGSPLTNSSHFAVITGVDDEYFYLLDPLRRTEEEYQKTDKRGILEVLSPGVVRIRIADYGKSDLSPACYISRGE